MHNRAVANTLPRAKEREDERPEFAVRVKIDFSLPSAGMIELRKPKS
jgi:hypothetical protein